MLRKFVMFLVLTSEAALADPLADMAGSWRGSGWAKQTVDGPQETLRCRIDNSYEQATLTLTITGQCIVPGRKLSLSGTLAGTEGAERITGRWSNPDGFGSARIVGVQRDGIVAFNFNAIDPGTGQTVAQNVEWRVSDNGLRLRSSDRENPDRMMSDISFDR